MKLDNTSAVAGINKMGSTRSIPLDLVVQQIWNYVIGVLNIYPVVDLFASRINAQLPCFTRIGQTQNAK